MAAVITRCSVASSIAVAKVKLGSEVGLGDGVLILRSLSLGVSFRLGSDRNAGFGEEEDCERVTRVSEVVAVASAVAAASVVAASTVVASIVAVAASSATSSSPHGHM